MAHFKKKKPKTKKNTKYSNTPEAGKYLYIDQREANCFEMVFHPLGSFSGRFCFGFLRFVDVVGATVTFFGRIRVKAAALLHQHLLELWQIFCQFTTVHLKWAAEWCESAKITFIRPVCRFHCDL